MKIKDFKPLEKNPFKSRGDAQIKLIGESITEFKEMMELRPIIIDENNEILGGNKRYFALKMLGYKEIPENWYKKVENLTEEQKKEFIVKDNSHWGSEWDFDLLKEWNIDLQKFGVEFNAEENEFNEEELEEVEPDDVEEIETNIKQGDIFQIGKHSLMCGDSTSKDDVDKLMNGNKADMVFTDPPYGMFLNADYTSLSWGERKGKKYDNVKGDHEDFNPSLITSIFDNFGYCKEMFLWGADYFYQYIPKFDEGHYIVWDKTLESNGDADSNSEFELCWTKTKHKRQVIHFNWFRYFGLSSQDIKTREHPTQKPLQVCSPFIEKYSKENGLVVDLFGGSGSTMVASEQLNRRSYLMELDPKYCQVIINRMRKLNPEIEIKCLNREVEI